METNKNEKSNLDKKLDEFLTNNNMGENCEGDECLIKTDKSLVERINKKIITEDGRQLLF